jgi:hypothetical protein
MWVDLIDAMVQKQQDMKAGKLGVPSPPRSNVAGDTIDSSEDRVDIGTRNAASRSDKRFLDSVDQDDYNSDINISSLGASPSAFSPEFQLKMLDK